LTVGSGYLGPPRASRLASQLRYRRHAEERAMDRWHIAICKTSGSLELERSLLPYVSPDSFLSMKGHTYIERAGAVSVRSRTLIYTDALSYLILWLAHLPFITTDSYTLDDTQASVPS
jgi:hypothetical protein